MKCGGIHSWGHAFARNRICRKRTKSDKFRGVEKPRIGAILKKKFALFFAALFFCLGAACDQKSGDISVYAPDGAPALSLAKLLAEDTKEDGISYQIVSATGIEARVQYEDESKNADICVLPLTDASLYLGSGEEYRLLGTVTHGNFFLLSEHAQTISMETLSKLIGKTVGVVQLGKLPGLTFRYVLERENVPYAIKEGAQNAETDKVNLVNVPPTSVKAGTYDFFIAPEPLVSLKVKTGFYRVGSLQTLYGENGYPQAAIVAQRSLIKEKPALITDFLSKLDENGEWLQTAELSTVLQVINSHLEEGLTPAFTDKNLSREAILGCNVYFASANDQKTEINGFISALQTVNGSAVKPLAETFFYGD